MTEDPQATATILLGRYRDLVKDQQKIVDELQPTLAGVRDHNQTRIPEIHEYPYNNDNNCLFYFFRELCVWNLCITWRRKKIIEIFLCLH